MNLTTQQLLDLFYKKLSISRIKNTTKYDHEIIALYLQIIEIFSNNYQTYRTYIPDFLQSLEENNESAITISIKIFFDLLEELKSSDNILKQDYSVLKENYSDRTKKKYFTEFEKILKNNKIIRMSDFEFEPETFTLQELKEIASLITELLQYKSKEIEWDIELFNNMIIQLPILRYALVKCKNPSLFYTATDMFLERLNFGEYYQAARDILEEILFCSFNDSLPEFGFLNSFQSYSTQRSVHAAICYANISMICILKENKPVIDRYLQNIIWESIKYFRNIKLFPWAIEIYNTIPSYLQFDDYKKRSIDHTYYTCLLSIMDEDLPNT